MLGFANIAALFALIAGVSAMNALYSRPRGGSTSPPEEPPAAGSPRIHADRGELPGSSRIRR